MDILREQAGTTGLVKAKENNIQKGKFKTININQEPAENYSLTYTLFFINKLQAGAKVAESFRNCRFWTVKYG